MRCRCCFAVRFGFCRVTLARLGFLDGVAGLQVCALVAYLSYLKHARLWELQHASSRHRRQEVVATGTRTVDARGCGGDRLVDGFLSYF